MRVASSTHAAAYIMRLVTSPAVARGAAKPRPRAAPSCAAHPGRRSKNSGARRARRDDDLVTPQGTYPAPWAANLAEIFEWEDVLEAAGRTPARGTSRGDASNPDASEDAAAASSSRRHTRIVLDGANIAWSMGTSVRSRFKCRQFPLSAGIVRALEHEPWRARGFEVVAFLPKEYAMGGLQTVCDGGGRATLNAEKVRYLGKGTWVNVKLMDLVDAGAVRLVSRGKGTEGSKSDDLTIIEYAKDNDAWICSNDQFRDHQRNRTLGFSGAKDLKAFARTRRFEHTFAVAPGLDDDLLRAMMESRGWEPSVGVKNATCHDGSPVPTPRTSKRRASTSASTSASRPDARDTRDDDDAMGSVMDGLMDAGGARGASLLRVEDECEIDLERLGDDTAGDGDGFGARTRNDNANALGGVFPYYAAPQECVPVFFEPKPTAAMIAARKSFLNRQGWQMSTIGTTA